MPNSRVLIAAGGTGGHVYPAIAIADALKAENKDTEVLFVGTKNHMEWTAVPKAGYNIKDIWISGFQRRLTLTNILFPLKLVTSLVQSMSIIARFKPEVVVSCGGYVAGPIGYVAEKKKLPVVVQEQNSYPGVTNRLLAKAAHVIFTAFKKADDYFPQGKTVLAGNPTRAALVGVDKEKAAASFEFDSNKQALLVLGGSLGARTINAAIKENLDVLHNDLELQIIWQCGKRYIDELSTDIDTDSYPNLRLQAYLENMPEAYATADIVVSRAGASSCSELMLTGKPSVLVPSPIVAGDHQTHNAMAMVNEGAAVLLKDADAVQNLVHTLQSLIADRDQLSNMASAALKLAKPDAAKTIAHEILTLSKAQLN